MSELKPIYGIIWKLMLENDFQLEDKKMSTVEFSCSICKHLLINAFIGPCGCRYCYQCISKYLEGQEKLCPTNLEQCQIESLRLDENLKVDNIINIKISKLKVVCPRNLCNHTCELINMNKHLEQCNKRQYKSPNNRSQVDGSENQLKSSESRISKMELELIPLKSNNIESSTRCQSKDFENLSEQLDAMNKKIDDQYQEQKKILEEIVEKNQSLNLSLAKMKDDIEKQYHDEFVWKIDKFSEKIKQIETDPNFSLYSDPFYAFKHGYKMCLNVDLDREDKKVTYLSICFCIMKGPYDDILSWPMKCEVKFALINQTSKLDYMTETGSLCNQPLTEELCKPVDEMNESFGFSQFIELKEVIKNPAICNRDQIFIRFCVKRN